MMIINQLNDLGSTKIQSEPSQSMTLTVSVIRSKEKKENKGKR